MLHTLCHRLQALCETFNNLSKACWHPGLAFAETEAGEQQNEALSDLLPIAESGSPVSTLADCMMGHAAGCCISTQCRPGHARSHLAIST